MRSKFPTFILALAVMAAAALAINPAFAESKTLNVPFDFAVAGKILPAGPYTVYRDNSSNFLWLRGSDPSVIYTWVATPNAQNSGRVAMRFDATGDTHTLKSVQYNMLVTPPLDHKAKRAKSVVQEISSGQ
jgi:hypothetical protein